MDVSVCEMSNGVIFPFLIIIIFSKEWVISDKGVCEVWKETVKVVQICTSNEKIIENKNRNCQKYADEAQTNNCTDYTKIRYHCVLNAYGNKTIEVCAPEKQINGFCTEFNEEVGEILPNHYLDCTSFTSPCKSHYDSPDAYLHKKCYNHTNNELVIKRIKHGDVTTETPPIVVSPGLPPSTKLMELIKIITIVCVIILAIVTVMLFAKMPKWLGYLIKRRKNCQKKTREEVDGIEFQPMTVREQKF